MADVLYDRDQLSDTLTPQETVLLVRVMEEAAELQHAAAKALRWGFDSCHPEDVYAVSNRNRIKEEFQDLCRYMSRLMGDKMMPTLFRSRVEDEARRDVVVVLQDLAAASPPDYAAAVREIIARV